MWPSSRFALSLKPSVAYLDLNLCALLKKQTTLSSFAYAGMPYQVLGERSGAVAVTISCIRSAIARSDAGISAIFASTWRSASALPAAAFSSRARSLIAARSSAVNPADAFLLTVMRLRDFRMFFVGLIATPELVGHIDPMYEVVFETNGDPRSGQQGCCFPSKECLRQSSSNYSNSSWRP